VDGYLSVAVILGMALAGIGALYFISRRTAVAPDPLEMLPFLSGWKPKEHALSRYHARWYPLTLIFLAFDIEMLFMYPWAVVVASEGVGAVVEMFSFLALLVLGVVWAWREGALRWV
jgi:NADH:ubiquinone oxidoreductase subunit 3 (subunit A)